MTHRALLIAATLLLMPPDLAAPPAAAWPIAPAAALPVAPAAAWPVAPAAALPVPAAAARPVPASPARPVPSAVPMALVPAGPASPGVPERGGYRWPLSGTPVVTRGFDPPPRPWLPGHRGVDLAGSAGEVVRAAGAGVVAFAGSVAGTGVVSIDHPGGLRTTYEPVTALVRAGDAVAGGQVIGVLLGGHPGCPVVACLHWGLRAGADYLDPLLLLHAAPVRLYPAVQPPVSRPGSASASRSYSSARL